MSQITELITYAKGETDMRVRKTRYTAPAGMNYIVEADGRVRFIRENMTKELREAKSEAKRS